jgi:hypothetical protein
MVINILQLKNDLQKEISKRKLSKSLYDLLYKKALEAKNERLHYLEQILAIKQYKLVFIGQVGAGKTTAICHLFNLIGEFDAMDKNRKVKKFQELLATGSGYTTICEVIIRPAATTSIRVEPYSETELKDLINIFAEFIVSKQNAQSMSAPKAENIISPELDRALRNMLNLKKKDKIDEADEFAKNFQNLDSLKTALFKKADFENRTDTEIECQTEDELKWLKKTFEEINVAKHAGFSIPKKIFLYASNAILNHTYFSHFSEIIDTKGLDVNKFRKDIDLYIKQDDTICLFTTKFPNAPDPNILEQMQRHLAFKSKNFEERFITFVMPRNLEPENTLSSDGTKIDDRDQGIQIRRDTIQDTFTQQKLTFFPENILFYDALRFYYNGRLNQNEGYSLDDVEADRQLVVDAVNAVIQKRIQNTTYEIEQIQNDFKVVKAGSKRVSVEHEKLLTQLKAEIRGFSRLNFVNSAEFIDKFVEHYRNHYHHRSKHAIHKRFGIFEEKEYDIFYDACEIAIDLVRHNTQKYKDDIMMLIQKLAEQLQDSDLESFIKELLKKVEGFFDTFLSTIGQEIKENMLNDKCAPRNHSNPFWLELINRHGKGDGYTDDICNTFADQLDGLNELLGERTQLLWNERVISKTLEFFG